MDNKLGLAAWALWTSIPRMKATIRYLNRLHREVLPESVVNSSSNRRVFQQKWTERMGARGARAGGGVEKQIQIKSPSPNELGLLDHDPSEPLPVAFFLQGFLDRHRGQESAHLIQKVRPGFIGP